MPKPYVGRTKSRQVAAVLALSVISISPTVYGQSWTGLGQDGLFSDAANWNTNTVPVSDPSTPVTLGGRVVTP